MSAATEQLTNWYVRIEDQFTALLIAAEWSGRPDATAASDLVGDGVDVAVRAGMAPPDSGAFIAHRLGAFRRVLVASPSYLRKRGTPKLPRDLSGHELLAQTRATAAFTRWTFTRNTEQVEVAVNARRMASSPLLLHEWAKSGAGIALIPSWLVQDLRVLLPEWLTQPIAVHTIHRAEARGVPRIAALAEVAFGSVNVSSVTPAPNA